MKEFLIEARALIASPAHWCAGHFGRTNKGIACTSYDPDCQMRCILGALNFVEAPSILREKCDKIAERLFDGRTITDVNDTIGHAAVLRILDTAIAETK